MAFTVRDLKMEYHMNTGHDAGSSEYYEWLEEEVVRLRGEVKDLLEIITKTTK